MSLQTRRDSEILGIWERSQSRYSFARRCRALTLTPLLKFSLGLLARRSRLEMTTASIGLGWLGALACRFAASASLPQNVGRWTQLPVGAQGRRPSGTVVEWRIGCEPGGASMRQQRQPIASNLPQHP
jgi:hypothetical protein